MRIECIAIGTELLTTRRMDTNSVWLGERLADLGLAFHRKTAVGDNREDLAELFREALNRSDLILTTGGLGPTFDDFTKELFAELLGADLVEDAGSLKEMLAYYAVRNRVPAQSNFKQVLIPVGAEPLRNPVGTAPGVWWQDPKGHPGVRIVMMPGVPREMKRMWEEQVEPRIRPLAGKPTHALRMVVAGVPESTLDERIREVRERHGQLEWTILANLTQVELLVRSDDLSSLEQVLSDMRPVLGSDLVSVGQGNLEDAVLQGLEAHGQTLAVAESMPGGLLSWGAPPSTRPGPKRSCWGCRRPFWRSTAPFPRPPPRLWRKRPGRPWAPPGDWRSPAMPVPRRKAMNPSAQSFSPRRVPMAPPHPPATSLETVPISNCGARRQPWIFCGARSINPEGQGVGHSPSLRKGAGADNLRG
jgi:competence/damage-inducible protein CinA-like protein